MEIRSLVRGIINTRGQLGVRWRRDWRALPTFVFLRGNSGGVYGHRLWRQTSWVHTLALLASRVNLGKNLISLHLSFLICKMGTVP